MDTPQWITWQALGMAAGNPTPLLNNVPHRY
jgi:hypothetical protein